jgi:S-DNA-T family DNA segregation ATPase FtsK/SpoIIIE
LTLSRERKLDIVGLLLGGLGLFTLLSFISPQQGVISGAWIEVLQNIFGWGTFVIPITLLAVGAWLLSRKLGDRFRRPSVERVLGAVLLFFAMLIVMHVIPGGSDYEARLEVARDGRGGGIIGAALLNLLVTTLGSSGTGIVMVGWIILGIILLFAFSIPELIDLVTRSARWMTGKIPSFQFSRPAGKGSPAGSTPPKSKIESPPSRSQSSTRAVSAELEHEPAHLSVPQISRGTSWALPSIIEILEPGIEGKADATFDRDRGKVIEDTLQAFGAPARVVEINRGPTITQFGVEPDYLESRGGRRTKVKVSKISSLADDLALALAAPSIRIEAPVPGKGYIGIEVPNTEISLVSLRDVMESERFQKIGSKLRLGLGQDVSGHAVAADLGMMPHLLIAGTTGSGKSVCVNSIITCLLLQNTPLDLRIVMIDPKRVELTYYNGIPHLLSPVIVELERVVGSLKWISREMDERYRRFAKEGVRNISEYNNKMKMVSQPGLPFLVVVIDELADLMMLAPDETERLITRMAQLARATGIHLVIATQRPSVDVVTGLIKANFPARIAFAVASSVDSRVILDQPGAERLLGRGDMLFQAPDASSPVRMQGSFVSEPELARLIRFWKNAALSGEDTHPSAASPTVTLPPDSTLEQVPLWEEMEAEEEPEDELFYEAVELVRSMRRASISLLQRRLRIGYTRAARLIDHMEEAGIIGPAQSGSQPREVLDYGDYAAIEES